MARPQDIPLILLQERMFIEDNKQYLHLCTEQQQRALTLRFGLTPGIECHTFSRIGKILNISVEEARQLVERGLRALARSSGEQFEREPTNQSDEMAPLETI